MKFEKANYTMEMDRLRAENDRLMNFSMQMDELKRENDRLKQTIKNNNNNDNAQTNNIVHTKNIKHEIDYISDHKVIVENEKSAVLRKSQQKVLTINALLAHKLRAARPKPFKCNICDYACQYRRLLVQHIKTRKHRKALVEIMAATVRCNDYLVELRPKPHFINTTAAVVVDTNEGNSDWLTDYDVSIEEPVVQGVEQSENIENVATNRIKLAPIQRSPLTDIANIVYPMSF